MLGCVDTCTDINVPISRVLCTNKTCSLRFPFPTLQILHCARDSQRRRDEYSQPIGALLLQSQSFFFQGTALLGACALAVAFLSRPVGDTVSVASPHLPTLLHNATLSNTAIMPEGFQISPLWGISVDGLPTWPERLQATLGYEVNGEIGTGFLVRFP